MKEKITASLINTEHGLGDAGYTRRVFELSGRVTRKHFDYIRSQRTLPRGFNIDIPGVYSYFGLKLQPVF